ncbi:hypothetical protein TNIN_297341 [Trichonephila inaurata madagascariensis]|uniref:Uncharacterized protein n=1 Tax=Trichonephila inaurata madagascariensis TaxID=2747483 RepID=A0A8X7BXK7_9ARAC|nr:hypothetical protein TNIN_297341 [Trichonephila inaurata madagascariensis]
MKKNCRMESDETTVLNSPMESDETTCPVESDETTCPVESGVNFPTFVDNHILHCLEGTRLKFHGYASDLFRNAEFQRTEAGFICIQNIRRFPYFNRDEIVTPMLCVPLSYVDLNGFTV